MIAIGLLLTFYLVMLTLPSVEWPSIIGGTLGAVGAYVAGHRKRDELGTSREMAGVMVVAFGLTFMPASLTPPISVQEVIGLGVGVIALEAIYVIRRFEPVTNSQFPPFRSRVLKGALTGVGIALGLSILATIVGALAVVLATEEIANSLPLVGLVVTGYFVGGLLAGALVGALEPVSRWQLGTMLLGIVGGVIVYGAVAPVVSYSDIHNGRAMMTLAQQAGIALACGVLAGPPFAIGIRYG